MSIKINTGTNMIYFPSENLSDFNHQFVFRLWNDKPAVLFPTNSIEYMHCSPDNIQQYNSKRNEYELTQFLEQRNNRAEANYRKLFQCVSDAREKTIYRDSSG